MSKQKILHHLTTQLRQQYEAMTEAARAAHEASTGEEAKQEGKYDTRGLEASYLADAQAEQSQKFAQSLHIFESLQLDDFPPGSPVAPGALVEANLDDTISYFLLTPCAGGLSMEHEGFELTTLSPDAPLYQNMLGKSTGDLLDNPPLMILDVR